MNNLIKHEMKKTFKRIDAKILMLLSLWPALLSILVIVKDDVFKIEGSAVGALEYANYLVIIQNDIFLPLLLAVLCASVSFFQEIQKKTIYFYKDISRTDILNAKYISIYSVYFVFLVLYIVMAFVFYYVAFRHHEMATGTFMAYPSELVDMLYTAVQIILGATFYIHVGVCFAIRYSTGMAIFGTTLFYMFARIVPNFETLKLVFPIGYKEVVNVTSHPYLFSMVVSLFVYAIYHAALYCINKKTFMKMQFN